MRDSRSMDKSKVTNKPNTLIDSEDRIPESVPYMQRLRDYYLALGYGNPYQWASYSEVPFATLTKPLSESKLALSPLPPPIKKELEIKDQKHHTTRPRNSTRSIQETPIKSTFLVYPTSDTIENTQPQRT